MSINFNYYNSLNDYLSKITASRGTYLISRFAVLRGTLNVGLFPKGYLCVPNEVAEWKIAAINAFIDFSTTPIKIKNIIHLETSEKVNAAYFIGMVFAQIYMQVHYGVRHLEHLKNPGIEVNKSKKTKMNPDLWGINPKSKKSYLVEAKGSSTENPYFSDENIKKAVKQLKVITQINYTDSGGRVEIFNNSLSNLEKLVIATHPNINGEVTQHIVDPDDGQDEQVEVNGDVMVYKHYLGIIDLISDKPTKIMYKHGVRFRVAEFRNLRCFIGINDNVFNILSAYMHRDEVTKESLRGLYVKVNKQLDVLEMDLLNYFKKTLLQKSDIGKPHQDIEFNETKNTSKDTKNDINNQ